MSDKPRVHRHTQAVALIVALGGFLMGFDASVISGVVSAIESEFNLSSLQVGWAVSSLTLTATLGMMLSGPLSDRFGRRAVLKLAAVLFAVSALASALAPTFWTLVAARMLGGLGVGAALVIAPMYIAEMAPAASRGRLVSFNQLNIVVGISAAFFSNYVILRLGQTELAWVASSGLDSAGWRWMLGVETVPAVIYGLALMFVPESPRWLALNSRDTEALEVLHKFNPPTRVDAEFEAIKASLASGAESQQASLKDLFHPSLRLVLTIGVVVGVLQQITGINSVFFYAPKIFEESGIGTNAAFMQAVLVGLVNLVFTLAAIALIDRIGRRPLLIVGLSGIALCMLTLAYGFGTGASPLLILVAILGFVASFAISIGPVMWVLFSELFPNHVRGMAISFVGLINSAVSFLVTLVFPWQLEQMGTSATFLIYGAFALVGVFVVARILPETKGHSLEELEDVLVHKNSGAFSTR